MTDRITNIYILIDPDTKLIRYVGKTILKPKYRLNQHINDSKKKKTHKDRWINKLLKNKKIPIIKIIDKVTINWIESEQYYINFFKFIGCDLCNHSLGGEGAFGVKRTLQQKEYQSKYMKNHPENWVINRISKEENIKHLDKIRQDSIEKISIPIYEFNKKGEIINSFDSLNSLSKSDNLNRRAVWKIIKLNENIIRYSYKKRYFSKNEKAIIQQFKKRKPYTSLKIKVQNITTNIVTEYPSVNEFIKVIGRKFPYKILKKYQILEKIIDNKYKILEFNYKVSGEK